jgi:hypothetical protein
VEPSKLGVARDESGDRLRVKATDLGRRVLPETGLASGVPSPLRRAEALQPTATAKRWGVALGAVLLFVLLTAIVLAVAIVGMSGVRAASATDDSIRVGTRY